MENQQSKSTSNGEIRYVNLYESEAKVYTRKVSGYFKNISRYSTLPLLLGYILLPWAVIDERPAVHFDLAAKQFHILWTTFWPQDFALLAGLLITAAFSLFMITAMFGRVWCGFTCPQTAWTLMFISVERVFEGSRNQQIKLDSMPLGVNKVLRKGGKHFVWGIISFITGLSFVGYFVPIRELMLGLLPFRDSYGMVSFGADPIAIFWVLLFTGVTYLNAGWLRVQVCKYMCPYARFQSVMYDDDTLAVHYDVDRGEPRSGKKSQRKTEASGDCVDCSWCVQVCPVDIDIRDGLQFECINCGLCVDACNAVMDKLDSPRGLIRFTSENALNGLKRRFVRPRLLVYGVAITALLFALVYTISNREPISVEVKRDRGARLYRLKAGDIQNVYTLKVYNMDNKDHEYSLSIEGGFPFRLGPHRPIKIEKGENMTIPVRVSVEAGRFDKVKTEVRFIIRQVNLVKESKSAMDHQDTYFFGPGNK